MRQDGGLQQVQTATGPLCLRSARSRSTSASEGRPNAQARKGPVGSGATGTGEASPGASKARPARKPAERAAGKAADSAARNAPDSAAGTGPDVSLSLDASPTLISLSSLPSRRRSKPPYLPKPRYLCLFTFRHFFKSRHIVTCLAHFHVPSCLDGTSSRRWKSGRCQSASTGGVVSPSRLSGYLHCYSLLPCASACSLINISPE